MGAIAPPLTDFFYSEKITETKLIKTKNGSSKNKVGEILSFLKKVGFLGGL